MDNMIKNALKYTIGIVTFLGALALYFFFMMSKNLSHSEGAVDVAKRDIAAEESRIQDPVQCDTDSNDAELLSVKQDLSSARDDYSACSTALNQTERNISKLQAQLETLRSSSQDDNNELQAQLQTELQNVKENVDTLQAKIVTLEEEKQTLENQKLALEDEKQALISANQNGASEDEMLAQAQSDLAAKSSEIRKLTSSVKSLENLLSDTKEKLQQSQALASATSDLESELATLKQEKLGLLAKISELEAESDDSSTSISGSLAIEKFETLPVFCKQHRSPTLLCVSSFEMVTKFNFRPNGFISLRLVGPDGDTIQRESIAAQEINLYSFTFDDELLDAGEYKVEIKIDDVFNQFNSTQSFSLSLPADLTNEQNSGQ